MKVSWVEPDVRDEVINYVRYYSDKTEIAAGDFIRRIGIARSKYYNWQNRYGKVNEHNAWVVVLNQKQKEYIQELIDLEIATNSVVSRYIEK